MRDFLKGTYSEGEAQEIYRRIKADGDFAAFCLRYMHDEDRQVVRKALWGLTKANKTEIKQLQPLLCELITLAMTTDDSSVRRMSLSIINRLKICKEDLRTDFLDFCLEHMADIQEYPGIQSLCMKLAYRMCSFFPELIGELERTLEAMDITYYSPAVRNVRSKILHRKNTHKDKRERDI